MKSPLEQSIDHWEENLKLVNNHEPIKIGHIHCALCKAHKDCVGCPVKETTGEFNCQSTPYRVVIGTRQIGNWFQKQEAVEAMLNFLKSLRTKRTPCKALRLSISETHMNVHHVSSCDGLMIKYRISKRDGLFVATLDWSEDILACTHSNIQSLMPTLQADFERRVTKNLLPDKGV